MNVHCKVGCSTNDLVKFYQLAIFWWYVVHEGMDSPHKLCAKQFWQKLCKKKHTHKREWCPHKLSAKQFGQKQKPHTRENGGVGWTNMLCAKHTECMYPPSGRILNHTIDNKNIHLHSVKTTTTTTNQKNPYNNLMTDWLTDQNQPPFFQSSLSLPG